MKLNHSRKSVALLAGTAFLTTLGTAATAYGDGAELFAATHLSDGYLLAAEDSAEGKCGEGKCGESKDSAEGKCGEGKCGESKDSAEGKCGEGKCGGSA